MSEKLGEYFVFYGGGKLPWKVRRIFEFVSSHKTEEAARDRAAELNLSRMKFLEDERKRKKKGE